MILGYTSGIISVSTLGFQIGNEHAGVVVIYEILENNGIGYFSKKLYDQQYVFQL